MRSLLTLFTILLCTGNALADDLLTMVFDNPTIKVDGKDEKGRMYYVLLGKNKKLEEGTILQLAQLANDTEHYSLGSGRFTLDEKKGELTIFWKSSDPGEVGQEEHVKMHDGPSRNRLILETTSHDDEVQVGQKHGVRLINYDLLPEWASDACYPYILATLPPAERLRLAEQEAASREVNQKILKLNQKITEQIFQNTIDVIRGE
ncbi:MAG: hypothetical protein ACKO3T_28345 [Planctomycetaceae bacterium]